jgi:hypothetical protein
VAGDDDDPLPLGTSIFSLLKRLQAQPSADEVARGTIPIR